MKNFVQRGDTLTFAAPYDVPSGGGCKVGDLFGVASYAAAEGVEVELVTVGVFTLPRIGPALEPGMAVSWNDVAKAVENGGEGNMRIGVATIAAAADSPVADVRLNGSF